MHLTKRDAEILMRLVDEEIKRICTENDVPNILAECAECGFVFDLKFGTDCPRCHHTGVKWARLVTPQEIAVRIELRKNLDDVAELERLFTLEDIRS